MFTFSSVTMAVTTRDMQKTSLCVSGNTGKELELDTPDDIDRKGSFTLKNMILLAKP